MRAPFLVPALPAHIASAVPAPTIYAVGATPGSAFVELHLVGGWVDIEIFSVIRDPRQTSRRDLIQGVGKRHLAPRVVVPVHFSVGDDMHQFRTAPLAGISTQ